MSQSEPLCIAPANVRGEESLFFTTTAAAKTATKETKETVEVAEAVKEANDFVFFF
jgi:hypothetical protein